MVVSPARQTMANGATPQAPPFSRSTRLTQIRLASFARPVGGGPSPTVALPTNGLVAWMDLIIRGTVGGTVGTVNVLGMASLVKRVTVRINNGTILWSMTGPNFHYLYRDTLDLGAVDNFGYTNARAAVTATGAIVDMRIPFMMNLRDTDIGLFLAQNRQTTLTLDVEWESDTVVTSTGTFSAFTCMPVIYSFTVPVNPDSLPQLRYLRSIVDESAVIGAAGTFDYDVPRGDTLMRLIHGVGIGVAGSDLWTQAQIMVNNSNFIWDQVPTSMDAFFWMLHGRTRAPGAIHWDFTGTSGLGNYGTTRDMVNTLRTTNLKSRLAISGATTRYTVREMIVDTQAA